MSQQITLESNDTCKDLESINYRTQMMRIERNPVKPTRTASSSFVHAILEQERTIKRTVAWARLERSSCIAKIREFAKVFGNENEMTIEEINGLTEYLLLSYERKRLTKACDVSFDKDTQCITRLPSLTFNKISRKYTLSKSDRRTSSSSSLGPGRDTRKKKTAKNEEKQQKMKKNEIIPDINTSQE